MLYPDIYDVVVVGGGHAGTEACLASARMGQTTLLISHNIETLGQMSCNPAIGGIGKSHLVKEIDALGGVMATAADKAGIQFRVLNSRKGAAVRATRAQADRNLYKQSIRLALENQQNLSILQQGVDDLIISGDRIVGIVTEMGLKIRAQTVILTAGTFLSGKIHVGMASKSAGRAGDPPSTSLAEKLRDLPFRVDRLKTGTPPRIDARSVNFAKLPEQWGDKPRPVMSFMGNRDEHPKQVCCWIAKTNSRTHEIIRSGMSRSPLYTGIIEGIGPRYCPSIEDKIERFSDKNKHQIFLEPEGLDTQELYPNGISTSLPYDLQWDFIRTIEGFENAHITRPGYAIEYDFFNPQDLDYSLQTNAIKGLFFAGQINGTTGYEEAASQGLIAGINAALMVKGDSSWCPGRESAYIGVLVDDLISRGTEEPYRMFTSRAEYRLLLREDNADQRLTEKGYKLGLVGEDRWRAFNEKIDAIEIERQRLKTTWIQPKSVAAEKISPHVNHPLSREYNLFELLKRPEINYDLVSDDEAKIDPVVGEQLEIEAKYSGYIERQKDEIMRLKNHENTVIPASFNYSAVSGLSNEAVQKLTAAKPKNLARASRIQGVTPAAISLLLISLKKHAA